MTCWFKGAPKSDLQAGAQELDDVAIVAGAQDEDFAPECLGVARLRRHRHLGRRQTAPLISYHASRCINITDPLPGNDNVNL